MIAKVLSYYRFTPLADPEAMRLWQRELGARFGITGRIIVSPQGINAHLGGEVSAAKRYLKATREHPALTGLEVSWAEGTGEEFPRLSVRVRPELVTFGAPDEIEINEAGVVGTGKHLTPKQVHELVSARGDEVVFFDGRNAWEAAVGSFDQAIVTSARTTADFVAELDSGRFDELKDRPIITYCTGGIRCEVLSSLMSNRGFGEVYQIAGGILRYGQEYGDDGLWRGAVRVFDGREVVTFSERAEVVGRCERCAAGTSRHVDCPVAGCKGRSLLCEACAEAAAECDAHR